VVNQQIVDYLRQQINAGYDVNTLKAHLIQHGYNPQEVEEAIRFLYPQEVQHHVHHLSKNAVIAIALIGLLIVIIIPSIFFYLSGDGPSQLLDLRTSVLTKNIESGDKLEFNIELSNLGKSKRYDVFLKHELIGTDVFMEETIAVETSTSKTSSIQLPDNLESKRYTLKTTAPYNSQKAFSTFTFNILKKVEVSPDTCNEDWSCTDWSPSECPQSEKQTRSCMDDNNCGIQNYKPETTLSCTYEEEEEEPTPILPIGDYSGMNVWEKLDAIKIKAESDPSGALDDCEAEFDIESHNDECYYNVAEITISELRCQKIISDRTRDKCINNVAKLKDDYTLCEDVEKESRKDSCYMNFVNKGNYEVCDKITNSYLKEACMALRDLPDIVVS
jgi:hypothetical protein